MRWDEPGRVCAVRCRPCGESRCISFQMARSHAHAHTHTHTHTRTRNTYGHTICSSMYMHMHKCLHVQYTFERLYTHTHTLRVPTRRSTPCAFLIARSAATGEEGMGRRVEGRVTTLATVTATHKFARSLTHIWWARARPTWATSASCRALGCRPPRCFEIVREW